MKNKLYGYWKYSNISENDNFTVRFIVFKDDTFFILIVDSNFKPIHISSQKFSLNQDNIFIENQILGKIDFISENNFILTTKSDLTIFNHIKIKDETIINKIQNLIC